MSEGMSQGLVSLLGAACPSLKILDIGAMDIGETVYARLLALPGSQVLGFEPNPEECAKLNNNCPPSHSYVPAFVGDGRRRTFHWCEWPATSSLYPPNRRLLDRFTNLPELVVVKETLEVTTTKLDDLEPCRGADVVKIDVQGATLDVLHGGPKTIRQALFVQAEVEFVPLYDGEPLFAEVDQEMRRLGFLLHQFGGLATRTFAPLQRKARDAFTGQLLWTDAIYLRSFLELEALTPEELIKYALIAEVQCGARDLALLALQHHDEKTGGDLWDRYLGQLTTQAKAKPPLK